VVRCIHGTEWRCSIRREKITEWKGSPEWTRPYDAQFDDKTYVWTPEWTTICLSAEQPDRGIHSISSRMTNVRHVESEIRRAFQLWLGDSTGGTIVISSRGCRDSRPLLPFGRTRRAGIDHGRNPWA